MADNLLETAHRQAEQADPSVRAAALLLIARAQSATDVSQARQTLLEGLDAVQMLPASVRDQLFQEARLAAAAVSPELLADIPVPQHGGTGYFAPTGFESVPLVQTMLTHGHLDTAFDYLSTKTTQIPFHSAPLEPCFTNSIRKTRKMPLAG